MAVIHDGEGQNGGINAEAVRQFLKNAKAQKRSPNPTAKPDHYQERGNNTLLFSILKLSLLVGAGVTLWLNVQPYIGAMDVLLWGADRHPLIAFILNIPLIGWVLRAVQGISTSILGILIWAIFQILELVPSILVASSNIKNLIAGFQKTKALPVKDDDPLFIKRLKVQYNRKPIMWLRKARIASTVAYLIDFVFCCVYYPPLKGGIQNLGLFMQAATLADIDWRNLALAITTLFAVELIVWTFMWLDDGRMFMGGADGE